MKKNNTKETKKADRPDASFPTSVGKNMLPNDYAFVLKELKERIQSERLRVTLAANSALVLLYWDIGRIIVERQQQGWGAKIIDRISFDLKHSFPEMSGFSLQEKGTDLFSIVN